VGMTETPTLILPLEKGRRTEVEDRFPLQFILMKIGARIT